MATHKRKRDWRAVVQGDAEQCEGADVASDGEDDYLSCKFVAEPPPPPPSASRPHNAPQRPLSNRERYELENRRRKIGLERRFDGGRGEGVTEAPFPPAMRMMQAMGYVPGEASAREPLLPDLSRTRHDSAKAGIGVRIVDVDVEREEDQQRHADSFRLEQMQRDARVRKMKLVEDARRALDQLSGWRGDDDDHEAVYGCDDLDVLVSFLRSRYHYCLFCGCRFDDDDDGDAGSHCPGPNEEDHV